MSDRACNQAILSSTIYIATLKQRRTESSLDMLIAERKGRDPTATTLHYCLHKHSTFTVLPPPGLRGARVSGQSAQRWGGGMTVRVGEGALRALDGKGVCGGGEA